MSLIDFLQALFSLFRHGFRRYCQIWRRCLGFDKRADQAPHLNKKFKIPGHSENIFSKYQGILRIFFQVPMD